MLPDELRQIDSLAGVSLDGPLFNEARNAAHAAGKERVTMFLPSFKTYSSSELCNTGSCDSFPAISITGKACQLNCEHCRGKLLEPMIEASDPESLWSQAQAAVKRGATGVLITGGSDAECRLPFGRFIGAISKIKERLKISIAIHSGLIDRRTALSLSCAGVDTAMIDLIGSEKTIRDVYHLDKKVEDFEESLAALCDTGMKVTPHIVVGLDFGQIVGEPRALEMVESHPVGSLVVVVVVPYYAKNPSMFPAPEPEAVGRFLVECRRALGPMEISIGCARPGGAHKVKTDLYALAAGIDGIAYPADGMVEAARALGYQVLVRRSCCSMDMGKTGISTVSACV